jgi:chromosome segregation ATPase
MWNYHHILMYFPSFPFSAFREESNRIRDSVNELAMKRVQLEMEVDRMERQVRRLADVEQRFEQLVQREGKRVSDYRQLIRENSKIQAEIKVCGGNISFEALLTRVHDNIASPTLLPTLKENSCGQRATRLVFSDPEDGPE